MPGSAGGSDITPAQAAIDHQRVFNSTVSSKYKVGAPAVARGNKAWLQVSRFRDQAMSLFAYQPSRLSLAMDHCLQRQMRL